jgi:hypothetical protein
MTAFHINPLPPFSRRESLRRLGAGFGSLGLAAAAIDTPALAANAAAGPNTAAPGTVAPLAVRTPHFAPKAKRIIQLFMPGGPSQVDTFDYKPEIARYAGQRPAEVDRKSLRNTRNGLFPSPFRFRQHGECGRWVSDIFPHVARCVDDICFIHSMHTDIPEHAGAMLMMNLGHLQPNRPSMGSWLVYGLGTENQNLPGFVAMSPRAQPRGGQANWGSSFLPGAYTGCYVNIHDMRPESVLHFAALTAVASLLAAAVSLPSATKAEAQPFHTRARTRAHAWRDRSHTRRAHMPSSSCLCVSVSVSVLKPIRLRICMKLSLIDH